MIDAHCHCHWEDFKDKPLDPQIGFCSYAINKADWQVLASYDCNYKAFGLHPWHAKESLEGLEDFLGSAVALGEIGLDYTKDRVGQADKFKAQLDIAKRHSLPIVIHSVGATKDTLDILDEHFEGRQGQVLFHFANFLPYRNSYLEDSYFSFSKKSFAMKKPLLLLAKLKLKQILIETDSFPNDADLSFCLSEISKIKGISISELKGIVDKNFKRFYSL